MESAAIAQTAERNNTPVVIIRTIADEKNDTTKEYNQNKQNIAKALAIMVVKVLESDK